VIDAVLPLAEAAEAQDRLATRAHFGRVLLDPRL
jgi:NADPH:quinone reductase-like Zn-dependent oxidoreductase